MKMNRLICLFIIPILLMLMFITGCGNDNNGLVNGGTPDGILEIGSRVKATNTLVSGVDEKLHIRESAGINSLIIGSAADGATGTILNSHDVGDGYKWWEISWDNNGNTAFYEEKQCCIGWSAETDLEGNVRYLLEQSRGRDYP